MTKLLDSLSRLQKKWFWTKVIIDGVTVLISSHRIPESQDARYAYDLNSRLNL